VVRVPGYRSIDPGSVPGATRFSEMWWVWHGVHSASWVQLRHYLKEKNSCSGLEHREYCCRDPLCWPCNTLYLQQLTLTSPTSGGHSIWIVCLQTKVTEFVEYAEKIGLINKIVFTVLILKTFPNSLLSHPTEKWFLHLLNEECLLHTYAVCVLLSVCAQYFTQYYTAVCIKLKSEMCCSFEPIFIVIKVLTFHELYFLAFTSDSHKDS
jgi:hypothetical protein